MHTLITRDMYESDNLTEETDNKEWEEICKEFCKQIGAELLFVNDDNFGYQDKDGSLVHMYADELETYLKNRVNSGDLKEAAGDDTDNKRMRKIPVGLSDAKSKDVINAVVGQLSDGIWENSPGMERYWGFTDGMDDSGNIIVYNGYFSVREFAGKDRYGAKKYDFKWVYSAFNNMDDDAVKKYFANKIKQIVKEGGLTWSRDNTQPCEYLNYNSGVTVRDAYKVYDKLLGRVDRIKDEEPVEENPAEDK